jgi:hypothetical protein
MKDEENLYARYDSARDVYVVPGTARQDSTGDVEYRFKLIEPTDLEPRYVGCLEKTWLDANAEAFHQALTIGYYAYEESFEEDVEEIIQQAREMAISQNADEFMCIVEVVKIRILDGESQPEEGWWDAYLIDTEKVFASVDGLWTLGPEDAYSVRQRQ